MMEKEEGSSRPSIGLPLGLALILIMLLFFTCFFSCYYHWDKLRALLLQSSIHGTSETQAHTPHSSTKTIQLEQNEGQSLTVLMPGDGVPKFLALPKRIDLHN